MFKPFACAALAIAALQAAAMSAAFAQATPPVPAASDPIVAKVDGAPIYRSDVLALQGQLPPQFQQMPMEAIFPVIIERMVDGKLLGLAGRKANLQNDPDVKKRVDGYEERVLQEVYLSQKLDPLLTEDAIKARYEAHIKQNPAREEVNARHILLETESQAKEIIAEIDKGGDFAELARKHSLDPAAKTGGDLGFFGKDEMVPEFSTEAFKLKNGEHTKAPVKTQFGWHIIKVEARRMAQPQLDELREQIVTDIQEEVIKTEVGKLRETAKIEVFNLDGSPRPPEPAQPAMPHR